MKSLLVVAFFMLSSGCASKPYWVKTWDGAQTTEIRIANSPHWSETPFVKVYGWTVCEKIQRRCIIFLRHDYGKCTLEHEKKHAAGLDHPNHEYGDCLDLP